MTELFEQTGSDGIKEERAKPKFRISLFITLSFISLLWIIKLFETFTKTDLSFLGVLPREVKGLIGIITAPLIHSDFSHLASNTFTLIVLMMFLFYAYTNSSFRVFFTVYIFSNVLVWIFGREAYHIGASGIVYGLVTFLFFVGLFRHDSKSIGLSLVVTFMYGGLVWGILPTDPKISFEAHLSGAVVGLLAALIFRNSDPLPEKYNWEEEETDEDDIDLEEFEKAEKRLKSEEG
ncbi:MAG: rhomboid family intramembrane serine protease [Candidatus Kapaibacterium sp.]